MTKWFVKWGKWFAPVAGCILLFLFMHFMQRLGGFQLPLPSVVALSIAAGITALGYLLRLKVLNRIGGTVLLVLALLIIAGMLLPAETIQQVPHKA
ncbi:MAG TPA: hypothetical protein VLL07_02040, partial [Pontiella sp.]|nr:hypothetical protein [Pontiella sp.]